MNWRERLGFGEKEKETFDRGYCTEYTIDNYTPVMTGWEKSIGLRYLKDDVYIDGVIRSRRLNNAFGEEKAKLKKLGKRGLSQDVLSFYIQQEEISRWNFGKSIVEKARDLELIEILTPRQAKERFENFPFDKVGNPSGGTSVFKKSGWRIFTDEKDRFVDYEEKKVYLLSPKLNMGKQFVFDVVSLDDLYEKDPEFIPEKIVEYETARNLSELASEIKFNYKIHEISPEEILPDFVLEVGKITNPKKRKAEIESMCAFGDRVSELDNDGKYDVNLISNSLFYQKVDMGDGKDLLVSDYLYHMGDCSSQKKGSKYNFVDMHQAYQDLQYRYLQLNPKIGPGSDIDAGLLGHPEKYTIDLDQEEESLVALRSENIKVRDFIERTADVADQDQFEERLRREMPSYYQTLKRFEEWLGKDSQGMNLLDEVVMNTVSDISSAYYGADEGLSGLEISLRKNLSRVAGDIVGNFEGVDFYQNHSVVGVAIHNYHLLAVLPQLVLKRMKVGAEAYSDSTYAREYFESLGNKAGKITKELSASYDRANVNVERSLEVVGRNREYFSSFKESLGITETQVARLINAAVVKKEGRDGFDKKLFRGLFNAMELEKRGKVSDMKSPAFKSFFKMLCPSVTDESWERI